MSYENKAAVLRGPFDLQIEPWPMPSINDNEVLVRMECVGVCGTDVKLYSTAKCGSPGVAIRQPLVIGHEGAGVVIQVGKNVSRLSAGARVAVEPAQPCGACAECRRGRYNLCPHGRYCSYNTTPGCQGNLVAYYKHLADFCHRIPDSLSMAEAAAVQPLAIAVHVCQRAGIKLGSKVAILGSGPIGVLCSMTARAMGAVSILITDIVEGRLETAKKLGVDHTLLVRKDHTDENKIIELLGCRPDVTIEACGAASALCAALKVTKSGGVVVVVGIGEDAVTAPLTPALLREVDVRGSIHFCNTYPIALDMVASKAVDLKSIITHHFSFNETTEAIETASRGAAMKAIVHVQK